MSISQVTIIYHYLTPRTNTYVCMKSLYKRTLDTTSRYKYIVDAYENMKRWLADGTEDVRKKKRYIHRHLALPQGRYDEEGKELLTQFAYEYVNSLLTYCSDDMKEGMCLNLFVSTLTLNFSHTQTHHPGYYILSVRTTSEFKKLPVGKVCSVYFHAVDVVLGRTEKARQAWRSRCHYPKIMFHSKKGRKGARTSTKLQYYGCFKRMIAAKTAVYEHHRNMLRLYEKYCTEAECKPYWGDDEDNDGMMDDIGSAEDPNEDDCDDEF